MEELDADIVVIGAGPSGQKSAIQCAKLGKRVVVVEQRVDPGGQCLFNGTIPSKTLREAVIDTTRFYELRYGHNRDPIPQVRFKDLNNRLDQVINDERNMIARQFKKNNIRFIQGSAQFLDPHVLNICDQDGGILYKVRGEKYIISTGSKPRNPIDVPFDNEVILDSTRLLGIQETPKSMIILGGGIIGSEYATIFSALGTEVTIVDKRDHILPLLDDEIGIHLQTALTDIGVKVFGNRKPQEIKRIGNRAHVTFTDGTSSEADTLLYALGRTANVDSLNLSKTGIFLDEKGYIKVNALFQSQVSHIYAVGDVIGGPSLASTSMEQGRLAARHACGVETHHFPAIYPIGIYTIPEISCIGYTEEQLKQLGFRYEVGRAYYYEIAKSHIAGSHVGIFKILFHADTLEILGVHVFGRGAAEVIHIGQMAMSFGAKINFFIDQVFNYPTYAEGYRVAALNGVNKIKHRR